jgi:hypothetical protein
MYDAVCHHWDKNRLCHEVDVVPEGRCLDVLNGSDSCPEESISFDLTPSVSHVSRRPSASSLLSDGERRDVQCS